MGAKDRVIEIPSLRRMAPVKSFNRDALTVDIVWSAGAQVRRYDWWEDEFWIEELSLEKDAVDLSRLNGGAPVLDSHARWSLADVIGVVERAWLDGGQGLATVRFSKREEVAPLINDIADGVIRNVSVGYEVTKFEEAGFDPETGYRIMRATDWAPFEVSFVPVGADPDAGARARDAERGLTRCAVQFSQPADDANLKERSMTKKVDTPAAEPADPGNITVTDHAAPERLRIKTLQGLARTHKIDQDTVDGWIDGGITAEEASQKVLDIIAERSKRTVKDSPANLGLSRQEIERYSITRAIKACVEKSWPKVAPYEAELSDALRTKLGRQGGDHTFFVPLDVQWAAAQQRDIVVGTASAGGYLVGTNVMSFIEMLRNRSVVMRLGATTMPGLVGSVSIPKQLTAATAYWFASEAGTATESNLTFGQITLVPKTVGGYVEISRQLLLQSTPNAEGIVNNDLARVIGLAVDTAAIAGPGTAGQPTGIVATSGVGTANPSTGTNIGYADMIRFQTVVAASNAMMPGFGYVTTPTVAGVLMGKPRFTNSDTPIWGGNILDGTLVGARSMSSLQVGSGSMLGGDFSQVVVGEWGVLEIEANPYAQFQAGIVGVRALYTVDVAVRYAAAFALGTGMVS